MRVVLVLATFALFVLPEAAAYVGTGTGYTVIDSKEADGPPFSWDDVSATGSALPLGDNAAASVPLPFAFNYFGSSYNSVDVCDNGYVNFGGGGAPGASIFLDELNGAALGPNWTVLAGSAAMVAGELKLSANSNYTGVAYSANTNLGEGTVEFEWWFPDTPANWKALYVTFRDGQAKPHNVYFRNDTGEFNIETAGGLAPAVVPYAYLANHRYRVKVEHVGGIVRAYLDGALVISSTYPAAETATKLTLVAPDKAGNGHFFDNVCYTQSTGIWSVAIASAGAPNNSVYGFWDDVSLPLKGQVRYQTLGVAPARRFVVSWIDVARVRDLASSWNFQITLFEGSGSSTIRVQYQSMTGTGATGAFATVGIENSDGSAGLQYLSWGSPAANSITAGLAVAFYPTTATPPWRGVKSTISTSGFLNEAAYAGSIRGTSIDNLGVGIDKVDLSIQRTGDLMYWDGAAWQGTEAWVPATGAGTWSYDFAPVDGRTYAVRARAMTKDARVEEPPAGSSFTYDVSAPNSIVLTSGDLTSATYSGAITGAAWDGASSVVRVDVTIRWVEGGQYWDSSSSSWTATEAWAAATGTTSWSFAFLPPGGRTYEVQSRATDGANNAETTFGFSTFTYNMSGPDSSIVTSGFFRAATWNGISVSAGSTAGATVIEVHVTIQRASDAQYWDGSIWSASLSWISTDLGTDGWSVSFTPAEGITHFVQSRATDDYGNEETSYGMATFAYDDTPPSAAVSTSGYYTERTFSGSVEGTASDSVSGIDRVEVSIRRDDGTYWDGAKWGSPEVWLTANGTTNWVLPVPFREEFDGVAAARAVDGAGNVLATPATSVFHLPLTGSTGANHCSLSAGAATGNAAIPLILCAVLLLGVGAARAIRS